jgi:hypothetical protein
VALTLKVALWVLIAGLSATMVYGAIGIRQVLRSGERERQIRLIFAEVHVGLVISALGLLLVDSGRFAKVSTMLGMAAMVVSFVGLLRQFRSSTERQDRS